MLLALRLSPLRKVSSIITTFLPAATFPRSFAKTAADDTWPPLGSDVPITLNDGDPTPTILPYADYPEWLSQLSTEPETRAALGKDYIKHVTSRENDAPEDVIAMDYDRIMRFHALTNRTKIKNQNDVANDL